jgi:hypothetical protein
MSRSTSQHSDKWPRTRRSTCLGLLVCIFFFSFSYFTNNLLIQKPLLLTTTRRTTNPNTYHNQPHHTTLTAPSLARNARRRGFSLHLPSQHHTTTPPSPEMRDGGGFVFNFFNLLCYYISFCPLPHSKRDGGGLTFNFFTTVI